MEIHYFQRYHSKENVDTANAILLLSRLYSYSTSKFYAFLRDLLGSDEQEDLELKMELQVKGEDSVPDAVISQPSFKIVIETKLYDQFTIEQLERHLSSFGDEKYQILLTLDPKEIDQKKSEELENYIKDNKLNIRHIHLTFANLIKKIKELIVDERDEFFDILSDYENCCQYGGLISDEDKKMNVRLCGTTLETNKELKLYYCPASRGYAECDYMGFYKQKAVQYIGKVAKTVVARATNKDLDNLNLEYYDIESKGKTVELSEKEKKRIKDAYADAAAKYGYDLTKADYRFFLVDELYETSFKKMTLYPPRGNRIFNLCEVLEEENLPDIQEIAERLKGKTW